MAQANHVDTTTQSGSMPLISIHEPGRKPDQPRDKASQNPFINLLGKLWSGFNYLSYNLIIAVHKHASFAKQYFQLHFVTSLDTPTPGEMQN